MKVCYDTFMTIYLNKRKGQTIMREARKPQRGSLPGTIWDNNGHWNYRVTLPGESTRKNYPLTMPGSKVAMPATKPIEIAEAAAWRIWEAHVRRRKYERAHPKDCITVSEVCDRYVEWSKTYYRNEDGSPTKMVAECAYNLRRFRELYGERYVADLEHHDMLALRDTLIGEGLSRVTINKRMQTVKKCIAWALDEDLIRAITKAELTQVANLKRGRSRAPDGKPVTAVPEADVDAVVLALPPSLGDMVRVARLTGMRPGELCTMRWADIERRDTVWVYRPADHKNKWRRHPRAVVIGPRAQHLMSLREGEGEYVFSPRVAESERFEAMRLARKTKVQPSQLNRSKESPLRSPGQRWSTDSYRRAIERKCSELGISHWHPNQLRHNCATVVRRAFGIDAARAVLGHLHGLAITDRYSFEAAEDEQIAVATPAMIALG